MLLEGLAQIDWASLRHAYGDAADFPRLFRAMQSSVLEERKAALGTLGECIWHQGTVYSASAAAIPFLYRLLAHLDEEDSATLINLFYNLSSGAGFLQDHTKDPQSAATWREILAEQGKTLEAELVREEQEVAMVRRALAEGLHHLIPCLHHKKSWVQCCVAELLARYPERAAVSLPALADALKGEADEERRAALIEARDQLVLSVSPFPPR